MQYQVSIFNAADVIRLLRVRGRVVRGGGAKSLTLPFPSTYRFPEGADVH